MDRLRHGLVEAGTLALAAEEIVDARRLVAGVAADLVGRLDALGVLLQAGGAGLVGLRFVARGADLGAGVGDRAGSGQHGEGDVGGHARHPVPLLLLVVLAAHLLELRMQVLEQVVGLDDEIARLDHFLAQLHHVGGVVRGGRGLGSGDPRAARLFGHSHHAP